MSSASSCPTSIRHHAFDKAWSMGSATEPGRRASSARSFGDGGAISISRQRNPLLYHIDLRNGNQQARIMSGLVASCKQIRNILTRLLTPLQWYVSPTWACDHRQPVHVPLKTLHTTSLKPPEAPSPKQSALTWKEQIQCCRLDAKYNLLWWPKMRWCQMRANVEPRTIRHCYVQSRLRAMETMCYLWYSVQAVSLSHVVLSRYDYGEAWKQRLTTRICLIVRQRHDARLAIQLSMIWGGRRWWNTKRSSITQSDRKARKLSTMGLVKRLLVR